MQRKFYEVVGAAVVGAVTWPTVVLLVGEFGTSDPKFYRRLFGWIIFGSIAGVMQLFIDKAVQKKIAKDSNRRVS